MSYSINLETISIGKYKESLESADLIPSQMIALAVIATGADLLWTGGDGLYTFTTLRGDIAEIYGRGLYQYCMLACCHFSAQYCRCGTSRHKSIATAPDDAGVFTHVKLKMR